LKPSFRENPPPGKKVGDMDKNEEKYGRMTKTQEDKAAGWDQILAGTDLRTDRRILRMAAEGLVVLQEPRPALVMMTVTDASGERFNLGEILVTEAEVESDGERGYGIAVGDSSVKALAMAVAAAVLKGENTPVKRRLLKMLEKRKQQNRRAEEAENALYAATKVDFETMVKK
jgi:phosphonate C-P lyase system protein PhnG